MGDASAARLVGTTIAGKYRVVQFLRAGGIANVYLAELTTLRPGARERLPEPARERSADAARGRTSSRPPEPRATRVALKVLREELRDDRAVVRRFERGVAAAARIAHPNVVRMGDVERLADGLPCCAMELLIGLDLADTLGFEGRLEAGRAVHIAEGVAAGLAAAHAAGVMHLDVKPENVFLVHQPDGREHVKLLDFGLAWMPEDTSPAGRSSLASDSSRSSSVPPQWTARVDAACSTPEYMAPEQRRGVAPTPAMDVFALGVVLHEMLAGYPPGGVSGVQAAGGTGPQAPDLPPRLARVMERALARDPADRFASMEELRAALLASIEGSPGRRRASR